MSIGAIRFQSPTMAWAIACAGWACSDPTTLAPVVAADASPAGCPALAKSGVATVTVHVTALGPITATQATQLTLDLRSTADAKGVAAGTFSVTWKDGQATVALPATVNGGPYVLSVQGFAKGATVPSWHGRRRAVTLAAGQNLTLDVLLVPVDTLMPVAAAGTVNTVFHAAVLIDNGQVLVTGGLTASVTANGQTTLEGATDQAYVVDATTGKVQATAGKMQAPRAGHTLLYLAKSNRVLVYGGITAMQLPNNGTAPPRWQAGAALPFELFDVATGQFISAPAATTGWVRPRAFANLVPLVGDKVVALGGARWPSNETNAYAWGDVIDVSGPQATLADGCAEEPAKLLMQTVRAAAALVRIDGPGAPRYLLWGGVTGSSVADQTNMLPPLQHPAEWFRTSAKASFGDFHPDLLLQGDTQAPEPLQDPKAPQPGLFFASLVPLRGLTANGKTTHQFLSVGGARLAAPDPKLTWMVPSANEVQVVAFQEPTLLTKGTLTLKNLPGMASGRVFHQATRSDGGAIVVSGGVPDFALEPKAMPPLQVFDSEALQFVTSGAVPFAQPFAPRAGHTATALDNGCVLFVGGAPGWAAAALPVGAAARVEMLCPKQVLQRPLAEPLPPCVAVAAAPGGKAGAEPTKGPLLIDMLLVIDHSSSMCQEQRTVAKGAEALVQQLSEQATQLGWSGADLLVAVTTVQQVPDAKVIKKIGQFVHAPAMALPPSCIEKVKQPCLKDGDCAAPICFPYEGFDPEAPMCPKDGKKCLTPQALPPGKWFCKANVETPQTNTNVNCSVNTSCQLRCTVDADCYPHFEPTVPKGQHKVFCNTVVTPAGCMFPPETTSCPPAQDLPAVIHQAADVAANPDGTLPANSASNLLRCNATVGANQEPESLFEGGLRSAWRALDPTGPNCPRDELGNPKGSCQFEQLVRPNAFLVVVVVSDDDDCSLSFALDPSIGNIETEEERLQFDKLYAKDLQRSCQSLGASDADNADLLAGKCQLLQAQYIVAGMPPLTCPRDCDKLAAQGGLPYQNCRDLADQSIDALLTVTQGTLLRNWRFAPVAAFVNRYRTLKADPAQVVFAAVTGDSLFLDPHAKLRDRASYYATVAGKLAGGQSPYICTGANGESGYGQRYNRVAQAFGCHGVRRNLCDWTSAAGPQYMGELAAALVAATAKPN